MPAACSTAPGVELGILETARGGMLLKGMGVTSNDVSVVTNVSADHLGLQGIDTVDQLAEVKAIVTKATRPRRLGRAQRRGPPGLGDAQRHQGQAVGRSRLRSDAPAIRESLDLGGRAITVLDGSITVLAERAGP